MTLGVTAAGALAGALVLTLLPATPSAAANPGAPTSVRVHGRVAGSWLTWTAHGTVTGAQVQRAADARFTRAVHTYTVRGSTPLFTPYGLARGHRYYLRVRTLDGGRVSGYSHAVAVTPSVTERALRVMSYNLLQLTYDGTKESGRTIAPWSRRRVAAAALIERARPDVLAVQEGWPPTRRAGATPCTDDPRSYHYTGGDVALRYLQVDSLCDALGGRYRRTDDSSGAGGTHPGQGNYLLYDPRRVTPVGRGGFVNLGPGPVAGTAHRTAAYQEFRQVGTGARFLVVSVHLVADRGPGYDARRATQTASLLHAIAQVAARQGVTSIVYAGDYNSYPGRAGATDTPGAAMRRAGTADAIQVAQSLHDAAYASMNQYRASPPHGGSVDHVFVSPGVAVRGYDHLVTPLGGASAGLPASDHHPVYVDLALPD